MRLWKHNRGTSMPRLPAAEVGSLLFTHSSGQPPRNMIKLMLSRRMPLNSIVRQMQSDQIAKVLIDAEARLCITPRTESFPLIYRSALEVHWDAHGKFLYSPNPREWSYSKWFMQILSAVKDEYGFLLVITPQTDWSNIPSDVKTEILSTIQSQSA